MGFELGGVFKSPMELLDFNENPVTASPAEFCVSKALRFVSSTDVGPILAALQAKLKDLKADRAALLLQHAKDLHEFPTIISGICQSLDDRLATVTRTIQDRTVRTLVPKPCPSF